MFFFNDAPNGRRKNVRPCRFLLRLRDFFRFFPHRLCLFFNSVCLLFRWRGFLRSDFGVFNDCNDFADFHFLAFSGFRFQHTSVFGHNFCGNLVGLESKERIARAHEIAGFFMPDGDHTAGDRFAHRGNFNFDAHQ